MADIIQLLPDHVANQIAAGEVVQRPSSVVKELLENSIDAGAEEITLIVKDGGKTLVQVVDNGMGMSATDARLSFERHATSKIKSAEDLFHLHTKGFRGEALASIGAIAHVDLFTRTTAEEVGTHIKMEGSKVVTQDVAVTPVGTSISVKNLFFNIPARRNFLKSHKVELRHIIDEFQRVALAHPSIAFTMHSNGGELYKLPAESYRKRIVHLFGNRTNDKLVPITESTQVAEIGGFVCKPEFAKKSRGEQFFFVNNRFIKSAYLHHAVMGAFEGLLKPDSYPGYFLYLSVPTESIDINIHPTKTEVKFDDEHSIYAILRAAVKHSLGQFNVAPVLDFEKDQNLDTPYGFKNKAPRAPAVTVDRSFNPFQGERTTVSRASNRSWETLYSGLDSTVEQTGEASSLIIESDPETPLLFETDESQESAGGITFQLGRKFIVTRMKSGLLIIDQNRAHQRVLYEKFLRNITVREQVSQQLLFPVEITFTPKDMSVLKELQESLLGMGFVFGTFDGGKVEILGLPLLIPEKEVAGVLEQLIADWDMQGEHLDFSQSDRIAKTLCKALAIKNGTVLEPESQEVLVNDLFGCKENQYSPFNKIIHRMLGVEELENKFN